MSTLAPLALDGAELLYDAAPDLGAAADALLDELVAGLAWRQERVRVRGREHDQPRLTAWYGDPGAAYRYSGLVLEPLAWTSRLADLRARVEVLAGARFNSVLANLYRDGGDGMGFHSDDEPELGPRPVIASLSLGEPRTLAFRSRRDKSAPAVKVPLASGSLLVMRGDTQANWRHGVAKSARAMGPRVNLTFRRILPAG